MQADPWPRARRCALALVWGFAASVAIADPIAVQHPVHSSRPELTGMATLAPDSTWDDALDAGLEVRVFGQAGLADPSQQIVRRYLQYVPPKLERGAPHPLVILLHGANVSAEQYRLTDSGESFERLADRDGFIVVYANGAYAKGATQDYSPNDPFWANGGTWRTCLGPRGGPDHLVDDVAYLREIIARVKAEGLAVDPSRIYLAGVSKGAEMAQRAAREMGSEIAGIGLVVSVLGMPATEALGECGVGAQAPVSVVQIYSEHDPLLTGKDPAAPLPYAADMARSGHAWRAAIGVAETPAKQEALPDRIKEGAQYTGNVPWALATRDSQVIRYDYPVGRDGAAFRAYVMDHAGHGWPREGGNSVERAELTVRLGFSNEDFDAAEAIWEFLSAHTPKRSP